MRASARFWPPMWFGVLMIIGCCGCGLGKWVCLVPCLGGHGGSSSRGRTVTPARQVWFLVGIACSWVSLKFAPSIVLVELESFPKHVNRWGNQKLIEKVTMLLCL